MVSDCPAPQSFSISANDLAPLIGTGLAPRLIDVCVAEDIVADPWRLPAAQFVSHDQIMPWAKALTSAERVVVICQKGLKLSHGAAARLRGAGIHARALAGGNLAWRAGLHPRLALKNDPEAGAVWVLPAPATAQVFGLAWLILRWFDPNAELIWVPRTMVAEVADRFDAEPAPASLMALCRRAALAHPPITNFAASIDTNTAPWLPLLRAVPSIRDTDQAQLARALPILDAAWVADREVLT